MKYLDSYYRILKHPIFFALSNIKKAYFKNDISVFGYSLSFFISGIGLYFFLPWIGIKLPWIAIFPPPWDFNIFFPFWVSFEGLLITFLVSLKLSFENAEDEVDFIDFLSIELYRAPKNKPFTVIIPNINLGQYNNSEEFEKLKSGLKEAIRKKVVLEFITPNIDANADSTPKCNSSNHAASRNLSPKNTS
jgi:hypothetical protein